MRARAHSLALGDFFQDVCQILENKPAKKSKSKHKHSLKKEGSLINSDKSYEFGGDGNKEIRQEGEIVVYEKSLLTSPPGYNWSGSSGTLLQHLRK